MQNESEITVLIDKMDALQASVNSIVETITKMQKERITFGEWVSEKEAIVLTSLSRSTLLKLRNEGKLSSSTISGKQNFYRISDFKKLLDKNEFEF